jgi:hypothetical protein
LIAANAGGQYAAGKNKIINGDFGIWQRGTSFTGALNAIYTADRWLAAVSTSVSGLAWTVSQQTFTPGTAPVAGYEGTFFLRANISTIGSATGSRIAQRIEDVRTFAGQTVTVSWFGRSSTSTTISSGLEGNQNFGSGGSSPVSVIDENITYTSSFQRFTKSFTMPSVSGKTIGTGSFVEIRFRVEATNGANLDIWGVQIEAGSTASPFQTATGTKQGELAACQRYYYRTFPAVVNKVFAITNNTSTTSSTAVGQYPVTMRIAPTALEQSGTANHYSVNVAGTNTVCSGVPTFGGSTTKDTFAVVATVASGLTNGQSGRFVTDATNGANAYLGWSAEL